MNGTGKDWQWDGDETFLDSQFSSVQSLSHVQFFVTPWTAASQPSLSITNSQNLLKLTSIESVMPSNHLILCRSLFLLPSIFPSIRVFSNQSVIHIRWPKYWSFTFSINPSNKYSGLISFRMDWLDLLAVQWTLKSLRHHHSSKASILRCSAFFTVQLSHPYMTTGKTIALTRQTFVGKGMSLLFNMLSMLIKVFLSRSRRLLILWLQSPSAVIWEPKKIKGGQDDILSVTISSLYSLPLNTRSEKTLYQPFTSLKSQFFLRAIMEHCSWLGWGHMTLPFKVLMLAVNLIGKSGRNMQEQTFFRNVYFLLAH